MLFKGLFILTLLWVAGCLKMFSFPPHVSLSSCSSFISLFSNTFGSFYMFLFSFCCWYVLNVIGLQFPRDFHFLNFFVLIFLWVYISFVVLSFCFTVRNPYILILITCRIDLYKFFWWNIRIIWFIVRDLTWHMLMLSNVGSNLVGLSIK